MKARGVKLLDAVSYLTGKNNPEETRQIKESAKEYVEFTPEFIEKVKEGNLAELQKVYRAHLSKNFDIIHRLAYELGNRQIAQARTTVEENSSDAPVYISLFLSITAIIVAIIIALAFSKFMVGTLEQAVKIANNIAKGDLSHEVKQTVQMSSAFYFTL